MKPNQLIVRLKQIGLLKGGEALDIGAEAGIDALFLNENGYQVTAVDVNTEKLKEKTKDTDIKVLEEDIANLDLEENKYDLIIANNVFPFIYKDNFESTFNKVISSLKDEGVLAFSFFGLEDGWSDKERMSFKSFEESLEMIKNKNLEIVFQQTEKGLGGMMNGDTKFWEIHRFIVKK